jgi:hypothetical protein
MTGTLPTSNSLDSKIEKHGSKKKLNPSEELNQKRASSLLQHKIQMPTSPFVKPKILSRLDFEQTFSTLLKIPRNVSTRLTQMNWRILFAKPQLPCSQIAFVLQL